jgi:hypothetical protein
MYPPASSAVRAMQRPQWLSGGEAPAFRGLVPTSRNSELKRARQIKAAKAAKFSGRTRVAAASAAAGAAPVRTFVAGSHLAERLAARAQPLPQFQPASPASPRSSVSAGVSPRAAAAGRTVGSASPTMSPRRAALLVAGARGQWQNMVQTADDEVRPLSPKHQCCGGCGGAPPCIASLMSVVAQVRNIMTPHNKAGRSGRRHRGRRDEDEELVRVCRHNCPPTHLTCLPAPAINECGRPWHTIILLARHCPGFGNRRICRCTLTTRTPLGGTTRRSRRCPWTRQACSSSSTASHGSAGRSASSRSWRSPGAAAAAAAAAASLRATRHRHRHHQRGGHLPPLPLPPPTAEQGSRGCPMRLAWVHRPPPPPPPPPGVVGVVCTGPAVAPRAAARAVTTVTSYSCSQPQRPTCRPRFQSCLVRRWRWGRRKRRGGRRRRRRRRIAG